MNECARCEEIRRQFPSAVCGLCVAKALAADNLEFVRLRKAGLEVFTALSEAHACATLRDDGSCDGCFVSEAMTGFVEYV